MENADKNADKNVFHFRRGVFLWKFTLFLWKSDVAGV